MNKDKFSTKEAINQSIVGFNNGRSPNTGMQVVRFCDVTLRDGQQQLTNEVTTGQRIEVFDAIVDTGVDRIEIGHLGNKTSDQVLAKELVGHIARKEREDSRYENVKIQVLFGSQADLITEGAGVLKQAYMENYGDNWQQIMNDKVVVHVYDRLDTALTSASSEPYDQEESAYRVFMASQKALEAGFTNFSVSGEATTAVTPEQAIEYYRFITANLLNSGAQSVNINLANTYGFSAGYLWNTATLDIFNRAVKYGFNDQVTTSIHTHNDVNSATEFSLSAITAGFDRVEGTHIGMGERSGNVASVDVMARLIEKSRDTEILTNTQESPIAKLLANFVTSQVVMVDQSIVDNIANWYKSGEKIAEIFGEHAYYRWKRTSLGSPYAHDNGSGPHDQIMAASVTSPVEHRADSSYEWNLMVNNIMGRPDTEDMAIGEPKAVDRVTVGNYAGGGKTKAIKEGTLIRAKDGEIEQARMEFTKQKMAIISKLLGGVTIYS